MLLLCKVLLGRSLTLTKADNHIDKTSIRKRGYDSVFAPAGSQVLFDEYIVYDSRQCVPAFVIHFSASLNNVPTSLSSASGGMTRTELFPSRDFDDRDANTDLCSAVCGNQGIGAVCRPVDGNTASKPLIRRGIGRR